ncbi:MAG: GH32 C-terminal domain-containing protein, partial [Oscillospiraceae bacterium]|nr:GH32 C-terminal domain-containing protein [Oscillospiraceae bacterium]
MKKSCIKCFAAALAAALLLALACAGCGGGGGTNGNPEGFLLNLSFDEGSGNQVSDSAAQAQPAEIAYTFTNAVYSDSRDPEWRSGVSGNSLLFDGNSNYISYAPEEILVQGSALSVSVWVAPRAFEWDDPNGEANGSEHLTAIVGQYDKDKKQGFILGYQRFGKLFFQAGTGEEWISVNSGDARLEKDAWNHVAASFDGKNGAVTLYLNGQAVGEKSVTAGASIAPAEREYLLVGKNAHGEAIAAGSYQMFSGLMDELKLYGEALPKETVITQASVENVPELPYEDVALVNILGSDVNKTQFHGGPYQHWMNEPHAPVYYNGMYHLFFQQNLVGTYWRNISWGHLVSEDMVNWRPLKQAIVPTENTVVPDGVWSGGAALDVNGVPVLFFTAGNDSFAKDGLISNQNIGAAYPADLNDPELTDWVICDELAIQQQPGQGRPGEFRDSHIWREGDSWYMLVCSGSETGPGGAALLYVTDTLEVKGDGKIEMDWQYRGSIYDWENQSMTYGTSWELPILLPLTNEAGTITKYFFCISPAPASLADNKAYFFLGDFDAETGKFTPDESFSGTPALLDYGSNVFTGPSALVDPVSGNTYLFSIMQDQRTGAEEGVSGWAHCVGLARRIWLSDDGTDVKMAPIEALSTLEGDVLAQGSDLSLDEANGQLAGVSGDLLHLRVTADLSGASSFKINVKSNGDKDLTVFSYDTAADTVGGQTRNKGKECKSVYVEGPLSLEDGKLTADIYIDRSLVEAFFNESR